MIRYDIKKAELSELCGNRTPIPINSFSFYSEKRLSESEISEIAKKVINYLSLNYFEAFQAPSLNLTPCIYTFCPEEIVLDLKCNLPQNIAWKISKIQIVSPKILNKTDSCVLLKRFIQDLKYRETGTLSPKIVAELKQLKKVGYTFTATYKLAQDEPLQKLQEQGL